jgi:multiple sugar transport system substrate-binding protein
MKKRFRAMMMVPSVVTVLALAFLAGPAVSKEKLSVWTEKSFAPQADKSFVDTVNRYARENDMEIEVVAISWNEFVRKLVAAIEAKATPDISMIDNGATMQYATSDLLADVSDIYHQVVGQEGEPLPVASMDATYKGKQYSIPQSVMTHALNCRKDLLDSKSLPIPKTWNDVLAASKALFSPPKLYGYALPMGKCKDAEHFLTQLLWGYGMKTASEDGKTVTIDSPGTVAGLKMIAEFYKVAPPGVTGWDDSGDNRAFQAEQVVFATNSGTVYMWAQANKPDLAKRMAIALTPEGPAGRHNIASMRSLTIFKNSANVPAAKKLLAYLTKPDNYQKWLEGYGGYYAPAYSGTMKQPYWQDPIRKVFMENAKYGHGIGWPGPLTVAAREAYANFFVTEMVQMVVVQGKTAEAAVKETAQRLKEIYSRY